MGTEPRGARCAALRMYAEFAHCMTETMEYYGPRPRPLRLDVPERDELAEALRAGTGAVVVTGHFGNWDVAAKTLREYGRPINVVMAREINATTHEYVREARERVGVRVIYSDSSVFSSLNMIRALRRNEIVAIQLDRPLGAGGTRLMPFFGAPAPFPSGPFVLARLSGAPLIPVFIPRLGTRHYAIRVPGPLQLAREARDSRTLERVMGEVVHAFEAVVRSFPTQWFQFTPFWPAQSAADEPRLRRSRTNGRASGCAFGATAYSWSTPTSSSSAAVRPASLAGLSGAGRGCACCSSRRSAFRATTSASRCCRRRCRSSRRSASCRRSSAAGFIRKPGGTFVWGRSAEPWSFFFREDPGRAAARVSRRALAVRPDPAAPRRRPRRRRARGASRA